MIGWLDWSSVTLIRPLTLTETPNPDFSQPKNGFEANFNKINTKSRQNAANRVGKRKLATWSL